MGKVIVSFKMEESIKKGLQAWAEAENRSLSNYITTVLMKHLVVKGPPYGGGVEHLKKALEVIETNKEGDSMDIVDLVNEKIPKHKLYRPDQDETFKLKKIHSNGGRDFFDPRQGKYGTEQERTKNQARLNKILDDCIAEVRTELRSSEE